MNGQTLLFRMIIPANPGQDPAMRRSTSLGPIMIASAAAQTSGWEVEVIDENNCHETCWSPRAADGGIDHQWLQQQCPANIVGFAAGLTSTIPRVYELAKLYRQAGAFTVAGSYHAKTLPEEMIKNNLDAVVMSIADAEAIIVRLLEEYKLLYDRPPTRLSDWDEYLAAVPGLMWQKNGDLTVTNPLGPMRPIETSEPEKCPKQLLPDFSLLRSARLKVFPIQWRRGCHRRCESCVVREKVDSARAEDLLATVKHCFEKFQATRFFIVDDCFGGNLNLTNERTELIEALRLLIDYQKEIGRRFEFTVQIGLDAIDNNEIINLMRQAGITTVCISYQDLFSDEMQVMREKGYLHDPMLWMTKAWRQAGFSVQAMYIFNYPEETLRPQQDCGLSIKKQAIAIGKWFRQAGVNSLRVSLAVPLPGSDLRKRLEQEGRLLPLKEIGWEYYDGRFPLYRPDDCYGYSPEELLEGLQTIQDSFAGWARFLRPSFYRRRPPTEFLAKLKRARESAH